MIVIQGAGIAGLTLAGLLQKQGLDYRVIEKSAQLQPIGAGILLQRNALEVLAELPEGDFESVSTQINHMVIGSPGEPALQNMKLDQATRARGVHRANLQQFLLQQVDQKRLRLGTSVTAWNHSASGLEIRLNSGEQLQARVLVGADGITSDVRAMLRDRPQVRNSGQWCARTVVAGHPFGADAREIYAGRQRLGAVPLANECTYIFWVYSRHPAGDIPKAEIEAGIHSMGSIGDTLAPLLGPTQGWLQHPLLDIPVSWGEGCVALIGDAAHALTPNLGQGAALGIEDACVLAALLGSGAERAPSLAQQLRQRRHTRVRNVRAISYYMGKVAHLEQPLLQRMRNGLLSAASPARSRAALKRWLDQFSVTGAQRLS